MNFSAISGSGHRCWQRKIWRACWLAGFFALGGMTVGSDASPPHAAYWGGYRPDNVYAYPAKLSPDLRRVVVLPLAAESAGNDLPDGCAALRVSV